MSEERAFEEGGASAREPSPNWKLYSIRTGRLRRPLLGSGHTARASPRTRSRLAARASFAVAATTGSGSEESRAARARASFPDPEKEAVQKRGVRQESSSEARVFVWRMRAVLEHVACRRR